MKKVIILLCTVAGLSADGIQYLKIGKPHRTLGNKVRVRAEPGAEAKILAELAIGTEIIPLVQTDYRMTQEGVEAPWYKVSYVHEGKKSEGFVWGNLIAKGHAVSNDGLIFLYGIGRGVASDPSWSNYSSQIRVSKEGRELARLEVKEGVSFMSGEEISLRDGSGFSDVKNIFVISFLQEYCGGKGNKIFIFWNGKKLIFAHSSFDGFDAPVYAREQQVFPSEKGGKKDHLYIVRENGDHDNPKAKQVEKFWLRWTGKNLEKVP